jgi:hypothetical protein
MDAHGRSIYVYVSYNLCKECVIKRGLAGVKENDLYLAGMSGGYLTKQTVMQLQLTADNLSRVIQLAK